MNKSNENLHQEPISKGVPLCTSLECISDGSNDVLKCAKCRKSYHYKCTQLPPYMIQQIILRKHERYQCINCVNVTEILSKTLLLEKLDEVHRLKNEIRCCENIISAQNETLSKFRDEKKKEKDENIESKLGNIIENVKNMLEECATKIEKTTTDTIKREIKENNELLDKKFATNASKIKLSSAEIVKKNNVNDFRLIIKEEKENQMREDLDRKSRSNNIIIHGAIECDKWSDDEVERVNERWTSGLMNSVKLDIKPKSMSRIGKRSPEKNRPIKIAFKKEEDKLLVLQNLYRLKDDQFFSGVSITEDMTKQERDMVRRIKTEADQKNHKNEEEGNETNTVWRVRGSPRTGLYLKRVSKHADYEN